MHSIHVQFTDFGCVISPKYLDSDSPRLSESEINQCAERIKQWVDADEKYLVLRFPVSIEDLRTK